MTQKQGKLFVISGSSGVGKGTLLKEFLKNNHEYKLSISATTRKPRPDEVDGVNYFFISSSDFLSSIKNNEFLEWATFSGNYYGTKREFIEKSLKKGIDLILEIDTQGALQVKSVFADAVLIFIAPPSFEVLEQRLRGRNTESEEAIQERLKVVKLEMKASKVFDYQVVNDNLDGALAHLKEIFDNERN